MLNAWSLLFGSRKFWLGLLTLASLAAAVVLRVTDKIPADALVPTITALTAVGISSVLSIAWEDAAEKGNVARALTDDADASVSIAIGSDAKPAATKESEPEPVESDAARSDDAA